jgi:hypothetical protein
MGPKTSQPSLDKLSDDNMVRRRQSQKRRKNMVILEVVALAFQGRLLMAGRSVLPPTHPIPTISLTHQEHQNTGNVPMQFLHLFVDAAND